MKGAGLPKLYEVLTPIERFRLMLTARAREDQAEVDRLERTCPRKSYTMPDAAYVDRRELIGPVVLAVCLDVMQHVAKLEVAAAFGWAAGELRERALECAERVADRLRREAADQSEADQAEDWRGASSLLVSYALDPVERVADSLGTHLAAEARAVWEGFARFCRAELEMPPETVMGALFAPVLARVEAHREALAAAEPDPVAVEEYARLLARVWRRNIGLPDEDDGAGARAGE